MGYVKINHEETYLDEVVGAGKAVQTTAGFITLMPCFSRRCVGLAALGLWFQLSLGFGVSVFLSLECTTLLTHISLHAFVDIASVPVEHLVATFPHYGMVLNLDYQLEISATFQISLHLWRYYPC
jgi:hypothetical protein